MLSTDPSVEKAYQYYLEGERKKWLEERAAFDKVRSKYWRDKAVELNKENIELKIAAMNYERAAKIHAIWVTVGASLLFIALFLRG